MDSQRCASYFGDMVSANLRARIEQNLRATFGVRLVRAVFYGSRVRGDEQPQSDLDVLVVLRGPVSLWADTHRASQSLYDIQLDSEFPIHALPVDSQAYEAGEFALYRLAKQQNHTV